MTDPIERWQRPRPDPSYFETVKQVLDLVRHGDIGPAPQTAAGAPDRGRRRRASRAPETAPARPDVPGLGAVLPKPERADGRAGSNVWFMRYVVLKTPWWECIAAGVPFLKSPGDCMLTIAPEHYRGPDEDPGGGSTDVIMNPHRAPELAPIWREHATRTVLYETENLIGATRWRMASEQIRRACPRNWWWNYSAVNAEVFGDEARPLRIPLGARRPAPERQRPPDLDVVFVGSLNDRRQRVLGLLERTGLRVAITTGPIFGADLAALEARARVVLNVHYYAPGIFEAFRVVPAAARGARVVSEASEGNEGAEFCAAVAPYAHLASAVLDEVYRQEEAVRA